VARDEPRGTNAKLVEQFDQARRTDFTGKQAAGDIAGRILASVRTQPTGNSIDVYAEGAEDFFLADASCRLRQYGASAGGGAGWRRANLVEQRTRPISRANAARLTRRAVALVVFVAHLLVPEFD